MSKRKTQQTVEIVRVFGGGYELTIDGQFYGIFGTAKAAQEFAASILLAESRS